jgi:succinoglycan biosynthesis transport protein ExoP
MTDITASSLVNIGEYFALLRREKWRMIAVASAVGIAAATVASVWPPTYRSTATILIEEADIPADLVTSTVRAVASERIRAIQQRIITTANLANIINKYDLYAEERNSLPLTQVADQMRANINLSLLSTDTDAAARGGRDTRTTIAFTLSFDSETPQTTQQVTNELASLFLSESQRERGERASGTTSFLEAEAQRLHAGVQALEATLEAFRMKNAGYLPEDRLINTQLLDQAENRLLDLARQFQTLRQRQDIIRAQLAGTPTQPPASRDRTVLCYRQSVRSCARGMVRNTRT